MKTKIISYIVLALIVVFPFKYAYLDGEVTSTFNILCMVAVIVGTLILMSMNISDGKGHESNGTE